MKYIKLFEAYSDYENLKKWAYEQTEDESNTQGFNSTDDAIEFLDEMFDTDFPHGLANIPDIVTLYRILEVEEESDINVDVLGSHFIADKEIMYDFGWLERIGFSESDIRYMQDNDDTKLYLVTVEVSRDNIELYHTISNAFAHPYEYEITLKDKGNGCRVVKIEEFDIDID